MGIGLTLTLIYQTYIKTIETYVGQIVTVINKDILRTVGKAIDTQNNSNIDTQSCTYGIVLMNCRYELKSMVS